MCIRDRLSADTSSTRQILNVLQADLATQSDALRELDQTWREGLASYQDRLSELERIAAESKTITPTPMAEEAMVDAAAEESPFLTPPDSPFLVAIPTEASAPPAPQPTTQGQIDQLASAFSAVSYTHLDVYKRQMQHGPLFGMVDHFAFEHSRNPGRQLRLVSQFNQ